MKMSMNSVSLKLLEFWESSVSACFAQTEADFAQREITAYNTKYYYTVSALSSSTETRAIGLLKNPPQQNKYETLMAHLLKTFKLSDTKARQFFSLKGFGDSKEEAEKFFLMGQQHCVAALFPTQVTSPPPGDTTLAAVVDTLQ